MRKIFLLICSLPLLCIAQADSTICSKQVSQILEEVNTLPAKNSGGSLSFSAASLSMGLIVMALNVSNARENDQIKKTRRENALLEVKHLQDTFCQLATADIQVFARYLAARRMKHDTPALEATRDSLGHKYLLESTRIPLVGIQLSYRALLTIEQILPLCKDEMLSDLGAGIQQINGISQSLELFVKANSEFLKPGERNIILKGAIEMADKVELLKKNVIEQVKSRISPHR